MPNYRRALRPGDTFFFTLVKYGRARFLCDDLARALIRQAIDACRAVAPFEVDAFVLLPDHLHAIWTLPQGDGDFSTRWARIKRSFTHAWVADGGWEGGVSDSRRRNRRRGVCVMATVAKALGSCIAHAALDDGTALAVANGPSAARGVGE